MGLPGPAGRNAVDGKSILGQVGPRGPIGPPGVVTSELLTIVNDIAELKLRIKKLER